MKRAIITDEVSQDLARAVGIAKSFDLDGIELRSAWDKDAHELSDDDIRRIREIVIEEGLEVACIASPSFKCSLFNDIEYRTHLRILERSSIVARKLNCSLVRGFTFWDEGMFEENLPLIVRRLLDAEPILRDHQVKLAVEYDPGTSANCSQRLRSVLDNLNPEYFGALWDPGNSIYVREAEKFPKDYRRLQDYILHVHVKDVTTKTSSREPEACRVGYGEVGFGAVFRQLAEDKYAGWLSLETHYRLQSAITDDLLSRPKGSAFSYGGEEASIESLESWSQIMTEEGLL